MKKIFLLLLTIVSLQTVQAQINFWEGSFDKALQAAKEENKLIFMDCYTTWCGPCKLLASNVFPQEKAGNYFNPRFVSIKMDMEKGEGLTLGKKYDIHAYPTLLVLNADGELVCRYAGYLDVDDLIAFVEEGTKGGGLTAMLQRYESGEREIGFIRNYLDALDKAYMSGKIRQVADDFLQGKADAVLTDTNVYAIFNAYAIPVSDIFQQVYARKKEYAECYGQKELLRLEKKWDAHGRKFLHRKGREITGYDAEGLDIYYRLMKKCRVPEAEGIRAQYLIDGAIASEDWNTLIEAVSEYADFSRMEEGHLHYACGMLIYKNADNKSICKKLLPVIKARIAALKDVKDTSGRTMTIGEETMPIMEYYRRDYESLLGKLKSK